MRARWLTFVLAVATLLAVPAGAAPNETRTFYMGLTATEYDATPQARDETYAFIARHADLIAHHLSEGVPWPEAYDRRPYPPAVDRNLQYRARGRPGGQRVLVYATPMTVQARGLGGYWGAKGDMPRPGAWKRKDFDDPQVITAYTNFASDLIRRLRPDFMAYGIEVNGLVRDAPPAWPKFVQFAKIVYSALKAEYPRLPIFVSLQLDDFWADEAKQRAAIAAILPYTDYIVVSAFPYLDRYPDPREIPKDYFARLAALAPDKPFAVAESGFTAKGVTAFGTTAPGREAWQDAYLKFLLAESQRLRAKFVVWFVPRDYDPLVERLRAMHVPSSTLDLFAAWKSDGLVDAHGGPRKSLDTWMEWLRRPRGE